MEISTNAFNSGLSGIQVGQRRVDQAASDIASNTINPSQQVNQTSPQNQVNASSQVTERDRPDLTESLVALRVGENEVRANARVVDTADEVLGTLIDTRA
jgi:flagellar hook protein FlgE